MPLPKLVTPTYELELPSTGQKIKYRPFLVKEEKILLLAMESEDEKQMTEAVKVILKNCIQTAKIKVDELALFDIEYLFLNIRGKSVGEEIELNVTCPDDGVTVVPFSIDIDDIKVQKEEGHSNIIDLGGGVSMVMRYPSMELFVKNNISQTSNVDDVFEIAASCISQIVEGEDVYEAGNFSKKELLAFLEEMSTQQFLSVQKFFETMPKLSHTITVTNPETGKENEIVIEGLASFFV
jgi:hypothetical protein